VEFVESNGIGGDAQLVSYFAMVYDKLVEGEVCSGNTTRKKEDSRCSTVEE
jgi:hypothetical protein